MVNSNPMKANIHSRLAGLLFLFRKIRIEVDKNAGIKVAEVGPNKSGKSTLKVSIKTIGSKDCQCTA